MTNKELQKYIELSKKMDELWGIGNDVLYEMCKKYPLHKDVSEVVAKIFLIGRSYAAAIERSENTHIYEEKIPVLVYRHGTEIDSALVECKKENLLTIFSTYELILRCFHDVSGKWNRSLASKYLHFHQPENFYIMDSRAKKGLSELLKIYPTISNAKNEEKKQYSVPKESAEYMNFYLKCQICKKELEKEFNCKLSIRDLDNLLLTIADTN